MSMIQEQYTKRKRCTPTRILPAVPMTSTKRLGLVDGLARSFTALPCTRTSCPCTYLVHENCRWPPRKQRTLRTSGRSYISCTPDYFRNRPRCTVRSRLRSRGRHHRRRSRSLPNPRNHLQNRMREERKSAGSQVCAATLTGGGGGGGRGRFGSAGSRRVVFGRTLRRGRKRRRNRVQG